MERAKRLELIRVALQVVEEQLRYLKEAAEDTLGSTPADVESFGRRTPDGGGPCLTALAAPRKGRALGGLGRGSEPRFESAQHSEEATR